MKNVIKPLTKSVLILLGLTAAAAADAGISKKTLGSGSNNNNNNNNTIIIKSNDEMKKIAKIVEFLVCFYLLVKQIKMKLKNK